MKFERRRALRTVAMAASIVLALIPAKTRADDKIPVVATFSVIADMVTQIAEDRVPLTTIVGPDGDSELYRPTMADAKAVAEAKIVFMNGINDEFEPWLEPLLKQAKFAGAKVVVSRGAKILAASEENAPSGKPMPAALDQHAWLDPKNAIVYVKNIAEALAKQDAANASSYQARAAAYTDELKALDAWAKAEIAAIPAGKRRIISSHDSLEYLARAYNITLISVNGWTNNAEPSAAELARLTQQIRKERARALFLDSITDPRVMQRIGQEAGVSIGDTLYGDALSKPGGPADTYVKMIRHDIAALKAGMLKN
ncbi:MAG: zinc/manganese transport system substrate-binding protein [Methylobacteriaceae bacterium]|nr:zinc/manganese transport system substrate-binding protein [Methylobacteriaceae bacterium]